MKAYRVCNRRYDPLDGSGAALAGGRWNPVGKPAVYASLTYEGALLELLVHANSGALPPNRAAAMIEVPDALVRQVDPAEGSRWEQQAVSRVIGGEWLAEADSLALVVPSIVAQPWGWNVVLNPRHAAFSEVAVLEVVAVRWDSRLGLGGDGAVR